MVTNTREKILKYIEIKGQVPAKELVNYLGISKQALFRHLKRRILEMKLMKIGKPPTVYYFLPKEKTQSISAKAFISNNFIEKNYLLISPIGERLTGMKGFSYWCEKNNLDIGKTAKEYEKTLKKYALYKKNGLLDETKKIKNTFYKIIVV